MINDKSAKGPHTAPFLFRFAERLPGVTYRPLRYDASRQVSQVFVDGRWIDTVDASVEAAVSTRETRVQRETTDDE